MSKVREQTMSTVRQSTKSTVRQSTKSTVREQKTLTVRDKIITLKENVIPKKQGAFYQLNLGKNNGPFLSKDIMYSNKKSMTLLTDHQLNSQKTMVNTMNNLDKSRKQMSMSPQKVQNFKKMIQFCSSQVKSFGRVSYQIKTQQSHLKVQLQQLNKNVTKQISQLYQSSMPAIKLFLKRVKENNIKDKEENYQLKKELERISLDAQLLVKGLVQCQNKIVIIENVFTNSQDHTEE